MFDPCKLLMAAADWLRFLAMHPGWRAPVAKLAVVGIACGGLAGAALPAGPLQRDAVAVPYISSARAFANVPTAAPGLSLDDFAALGPIEGARPFLTAPSGLADAVVLPVASVGMIETHQPVPEPASVVIMLFAVGVVLFVLRCNKRM